MSGFLELKGKRALIISGTRGAGAATIVLFSLLTTLARPEGVEPPAF